MNNKGFGQLSVDFSVCSVARPLHDLGAELSLKPSHELKRGDEFSTRSGTHKRARNVWQLRSEKEVLSDDLEEHIAWILSRIEPAREVLLGYVHDTEVEVAIRINCRCPDSIGGMSLCSKSMERLAALSNRIDISFIGGAGDY